MMTNQTEDQTLREQALDRIKKKRDFIAHLVSFVLINSFIVIIWATVTGGGFFWPMFPILGWGIGLFFHAWDVYRPPPSEGEIGREMERLRRSQ